MDKGMEKKDKNNLLNILIKERTVKALDKAFHKSWTYQKAQKQQDKAFDILNKAKLSKEQSSIVDNVISASNACGAAYGAAAYKLGLQDGIRLMSELNSIK